MFLTILAVLIVLSPIVLVHEFGHYLTCRLTGIRVKEFAFGFGKILWHKKVGETDYQVRAIPFGGFVEPAGPMFHLENAPEPPKPYEFAAKKWYAKFFMVVNGALFNYLLAALIAGAFAAKLPRKFGWLALGCVVGCAACYVLGTIWFMVLTGLDLPTSLTYCVIPYLPGDVIKIALASLLTIQLDKRMPKI